jgi:hypothetical protein
MKQKRQVFRLTATALIAILSVACSSEPDAIDASQSQPPNSPKPNDGSLNDDSQSKPAEKELNSTETSCDQPPLAARTTLDVQYKNTLGVDKNLQSLDLYMPEVKNPCAGVPVVAWVHGGAWMIGDKSQIGFKAQYFNSMGYGFVSINYRLSPNLLKDIQPLQDSVKFPDHPSDVGAALGWIHKNILTHGGDPNKLALLGHSAGAHLAALVALDQTYIKDSNSSWNPQSLRCVGSYDTEAYDVTAAIQSASQQQQQLYINAFGILQVQWTKASPITHVKELALPFQLALRGDIQRQEILQEFKAALERKNNKTEVINAQELTHEEVGRVIGSPADQVMTPAVTQFIRKTCFDP